MCITSIVRIHVVYYWHQVINCIQLHNKNDTVVVNSSVHFNVCIVWTDLIRCHLCLKRHAIEYTWTVCRVCRAYGSLHHKRIQVKIVLLGPRNSWLETLDCYSSGRPKETSYNYLYLQCSGINYICSHSVRLTLFSQWTLNDLPNHP